MGVAVAAAVTSVLPWILAWFALGGNAESVQKNIEGFGSAITEGPVKTATNAWIEIVGIGALFGFGIWILESKYAKSQGYDVAPPPVESIHVAQAPTFGSSGGYTANAGPVGVHAGVTSSGGGGSRAAGVGPAATKRSASKAIAASRPVKSSAFTG